MWKSFSEDDDDDDDDDVTFTECLFLRPELKEEIRSGKIKKGKSTRKRKRNMKAVMKCLRKLRKKSLLKNDNGKKRRNK